MITVYYNYIHCADFLVCLEPSVNLTEMQSAYAVCKLPQDLDQRILAAMFCLPGDDGNSCVDIAASGKKCSQISNFYFRVSLNSREIEIFVLRVPSSSSLTNITCIEEDLRPIIPDVVGKTSAVILVELGDTGKH